MKRYINIKGYNQSFPYLIEYKKGNVIANDCVVNWCNDYGVIRLHEKDVKYYRNTNEWYSVDNLKNVSSQYVPSDVNLSKITVYIPQHSLSTYMRGIKYAVTANTWINGKKIDLGSFIFKPTDTYAIPSKLIKNGNNEYCECIDFDIIDPFYLTYADKWIDFRYNVCKEPKNINTSCSFLQLSLFVIDEFDNRYMINSDILGGCTSFDISDHPDLLSLNLSVNNEPLGFKFDMVMNEEYDWFLDYLYETYNITTTHADIKFDLVLKNSDAVIVGPQMTYVEHNDNDNRYNPSQIMTYDYVKNTKYVVGEIDRTGIKTFFSTWDAFDDGWSLVGSLTVFSDNVEAFTIVSNELPVTQELFSKFVNDGLEKIIDINDMNITKYNVVNKIENKIVQIDRPNDSKSNIIQPVFFRSVELENITIHPMVNENISINLDDYKSKVDKFTLLIDGCKFNQIGSNNYGILFKITANTLPSTSVNGIYYILDENMELVTTGKYTCIK